MLCQRCNEKEADIHVRQISEDGAEETHALCRFCAMEMGGAALPKIAIGMALKDLLMSLESIINADEDEEEDENSRLICQECGHTYAEFKKDMILGCVGCYSTFREPLVKFILKIHDWDIASSKKEIPKDIPVWSELDDLRLQLSLALDKEEYEQAAVLRDKIKELEASKASKEVNEDIKKSDEP